jgi:hypothetical protein
MLMETAGMFEIRAAAGEQVLKLASDKNIEVRLASFTDGNEYSFYQLDETQKNWSYKGTARPEVNEKRAIVESQIASLSKSPVFPFTSDYFALSVGSMLDLMLNNDYSRISANKNRNIVIDKAKAYGFAVYDISGWANVKFGPDYYYTGEILWYKKGGLQLPTWTKKSCNVSEANALGNKMYELTILEDVDKNPRSTKIRAQAYLPLRYVLKSKPEKWQSDYDAIMKKISDKEQELVVTASVFRTFNISALGFCNWDQLKDLGQPLELAANFDWGQEADADELPYVYYFVNQHKTYVRIAPQEWAHIKLAEDSTAFFLAVISPETIAVFDNAAYRQIDFAKLRSAQTRELQFPMKTQSATTRATLEALLQETKKGQGR